MVSGIRLLNFIQGRLGIGYLFVLSSIYIHKLVSLYTDIRITTMRTEQEIRNLIIDKGKSDERIRVVLLNGSRQTRKLTRQMVGL